MDATLSTTPLTHQIVVFGFYVLLALPMLKVRFRLVPKFAGVLVLAVLVQILMTLFAYPLTAFELIPASFPVFFFACIAAPLTEEFYKYYVTKKYYEINIFIMAAWTLIIIENSLYFLARFLNSALPLFSLELHYVHIIARWPSILMHVLTAYIIYLGLKHTRLRKPAFVAAIFIHAVFNFIMIT